MIHDAINQLFPAISHWVYEKRVLNILGGTMKLVLKNYSLYINI